MSHTLQWANAYQAASPSYSTTTLLDDGNNATGESLTGAALGTVNIQILLTFSSTTILTALDCLIGWEDVLSKAWEYWNGSAWVTMNSGPALSHNGVFSTGTISIVSGLPAGGATLYRLSIRNVDTNGVATHIAAYEMTWTEATGSWSGEADGTSTATATYGATAAWSGESDGTSTASLTGAVGGTQWSGTASGTSESSGTLGATAGWSGVAEGASGPNPVLGDGGIQQGCGGCGPEITPPCTLPNSNVDATLTWKTPSPFYSFSGSTPTGILAGGFDLTACSVDPTPYYSNDNFNTCYQTQIGTRYRYNFDNAVLTCADNPAASPPQFAGMSVTRVYYYYEQTRTTTLYDLDVVTGLWVVRPGQPTVVTSHLTGFFDSHDQTVGYTWYDFYTGKRKCRGLSFINLTISDDNYDCNNWVNHATRPPGRVRTVVSTTHTTPVFRADVRIRYYHCTGGAGLTCPGVLTWSLGGVWRRKKYDSTHYGSFYKNAPLSIFYKVCEEPHPVSYCGTATMAQGNPNGDHIYQRNGQVSVDVVTTDCNGAYSWSRTGVITGIGIALGVWIVNPNFNAMDCSGYDTHGNPNSQYFIRDPSVTEWLCADSSGSDITFASTPANNQFQLHDGNYAETSLSHAQASPALWTELYAPPAWPNTGFTVDIADAAPDIPVRCVAYKNGQWHDVSALYNGQAGHGTLTIGDACGASGVCNYLGVGLSGLQLSVPYTVDWYEINSVVPAGHTLTSAEVSAGPVYNPYGPGAACGRPSGIEIYPTNQINAVNAHATSREGGPELFVYLGDFSGPQGLIHSASSFRSTVTLAWVTSAGAVKVATHRGMQAHLSDHDGWESTITLTASGAQGVGVTYTQDGWLYVNAGTAGEWVSYDQGATFASFTGTGPPTDCGPSAQGAGETWTSFILGDRGALNPCLGRCQDNRGRNWVYSTIGAGVFDTIPLYTAVCFLESQWAFMYNSTGGTAFLARIDKWTDPHLTMLSNAALPVHGTGAGMAAAGGKVLVLLLWDQVSHKCHSAASGDRGITWFEGSDIPTIPALVNPPVLVSLEGGSVAAVWEQGDVPAFQMSFDAGRNWG